MAHLDRQQISRGRVLTFESTEPCPCIAAAPCINVGNLKLSDKFLPVPAMSRPHYMCKPAHSLTPMTLHHHLSSAALSEIQCGIIPIRHSLSHNDKVAGDSVWTCGIWERLRESPSSSCDAADAPRIFLVWGASRARFGDVTCSLWLKPRTNEREWLLLPRSIPAPNKAKHGDNLRQTSFR